MAQYWEFINLDKGAKLRRGWSSNFWEFLKWTPTEQLVGLLRKTHWLPFQVHASRIAASKVKSRSQLVCLPQEVIDRIVYYLTCDLDIIFLALTCAYFFRLLASAIQDILRADSGPWAGDKLVFVGDAGGRGRPHDLYDIIHPATSILAEGEPVVAEGNLARWHNSSHNQVKVYGKLFRTIREELKGERGSFRRLNRLAKLLKEEPRNIKYGDRAAVLRNLTTKEYVRDAALAASEYAYSLGEVVMVQTIWSDDPKDVWRLGTKAAWTTHRFDISVMEDVTGDEWTDASHEAVQRMGLAATERFKKRDGRRVHWPNAAGEAS